MITLKIQGDDILEKAFAGLTDPAERQDLFENIGSYLLSSTQERFIQEKSPDGTPWKQSRRAREEGGKTLRNEGHLFGSLNYEAFRNYVEVGTNRINAAIHQFGGVIRAKTAKGLRFVWMNEVHVRMSVTMPARPYLGVNEADRHEIGQLAVDWMAGRVAP